MNFNYRDYRCSRMTTAASGLMCLYSSAENRCFGGNFAARLVTVLASVSLWGQQGPNWGEHNSRPMTFTFQVQVSANVLRQLPFPGIAGYKPAVLGL